MTDVRLRRGTTEILRNVNWHVARGEHWALLGPNGAGKTSVLMMAATQLFPTSGTVDVLGWRLGRVDVFTLRPRIGLASTNLAQLIPAGERVADAVLTAKWAVLGRWRETFTQTDTERAAEVLRLMGIEHLADRHFGTLSEGERRRTQVARALMCRPDLLLLDEPFAGLDLGGREDLIQRLARLGTDRPAPTTVLVTHHLEELPPTITHCALLRDGAVLAAGPADQVLTSELVTAAFGIDVEVNLAGGRWSARATPDPMR